MELKIQKEMVELKEKLVKMEKEMVEFSDLDGLRTRAEEKRRNLAEEKEQLDERKGAVTQNLQEIESTVKSLKVCVTLAGICQERFLYTAHCFCKICYYIPSC